MSEKFNKKKKWVISGEKDHHRVKSYNNVFVHSVYLIFIVMPRKVRQNICFDMLKNRVMSGQKEGNLAKPEKTMWTF